MQLQLKPSRMEFSLVGCCHCSALLCLFLVDLHVLLLLLLALLIGASLLSYSLLDVNGRAFELHTALAVRAGAREQSCPVQSLLLGQQQTLLRLRAQELTAGLPRIRYYSEYLIVLSFLPLLPSKASRVGRQAPAGEILLRFWPDTLSSADDRRLRRYLRFDCPQLPA